MNQRPQLFVLKSEHSEQVKELVRASGIDFELFEESDPEQAYHFYHHHGIAVVPALKLEGEIIYGISAIGIYCERRRKG